jgi:phage host-nuclease inhibitor protein Gam|tara:strand:+ start:1001 stop:1249 length:249 start_codon:yes stop_codon:yes gene_type:complete
MTHYIATVEADDVQDAIHTVFDQSVSEELAQEVLDYYVQTDEIMAPSGCTSKEHEEVVQKALVEQLSKHKDEITTLIRTSDY